MVKALADLRSPDRSTAEPTATTAADVLAALDAAFVQRGLVLSIAYMFGSPDLTIEDEYAKVRSENAYVAEQVSAAPDRLVAACSINPLADYAFDEIERCASQTACWQPGSASSGPSALCSQPIGLRGRRPLTPGSRSPRTRGSSPQALPVTQQELARIFANANAIVDRR